MKQFHKNIRLPHYNYSSSGAYFVTLVVAGRECCLSYISDGLNKLTDTGKLVVQGWRWLAEQYAYVSLDEFIVMPNHVHGILLFDNDKTRGLTLGRIVAAFKTITTRDINCLRNTPGKRFWQKDFYEHVIRDERDMARIREYIANNPLQWSLDKENPERKTM
ncbi:transposase [bacterium]|nr:transposase [bacterium]